MPNQDLKTQNEVNISVTPDANEFARRVNSNSALQVGKLFTASQLNIKQRDLIFGMVNRYANRGQAFEDGSGVTGFYSSYNGLPLSTSDTSAPKVNSVTVFRGVAFTNYSYIPGQMATTQLTLTVGGTLSLRNGPKDVQDGDTLYMIFMPSVGDQNMRARLVPQLIPLNSSFSNSIFGNLVNISIHDGLKGQQFSVLRDNKQTPSIEQEAALKLRQWVGSIFVIVLEYAFMSGLAVPNYAPPAIATGYKTDEVQIYQSLLAGRSMRQMMESGPAEVNETTGVLEYGPDSTTGFALYPGGPPRYSKEKVIKLTTEINGRLVGLEQSFTLNPAVAPVGNTNIVDDVISLLFSEHMDGENFVSLLGLGEHKHVPLNAIAHQTTHSSADFQAVQNAIVSSIEQRRVGKARQNAEPGSWVYTELK